MDFLDPEKKRSHNRRLLIGYILVGLAILLTSIILIILTNGYDINRKTGEVIQNGLIFADSAPESTTIYLNGKENGQTDKRLTVPSGKYDIELRRDGYRTWKKTIQLEGSSIERLVYPRLFPTKLAQATGATYTGVPSFSTQSLDRRWLLVAEPGSLTTFQLFDTGSPTKAPTTLAVPTGVMTQPTTGAQSLTLVEWSSDNRHVLLRHDFDGTYEFIMLDREVSANATNITKLIGTNPTTITLRDKKFDQLYLHDATSRQLVSYSTKTKESDIKIDGVLSFKPYADNMVLYSMVDPAKPGKTLVRIWDDGKTYLLHTYNETDTLLEMAQFDGAWYVVVVPVKEGRAYIFKDPLDKLKAKPSSEATADIALRISGAQFVSFSANTRFIAVQAGKKMSVYDLETDRRTAFEMTGELSEGQKISWMDGHRFMITQFGKVVVVDYDGTNRQELASHLPGVLPYFTRDYLRLYTLSPSAKDATKVELIRSSLKLNQKP